jgi:hypothetical protein
LDELHERVRILKARVRIEAGDFEEFPVALHGPVYPPRPHFLTCSPASDLDSGHVLVPSPFGTEILACVRLAAGPSSPAHVSAGASIYIRQNSVATPRGMGAQAPSSCQRRSFTGSLRLTIEGRRRMNETPAEQLGEHILEIVKAVVDEYPDAPDNAIVEIIKERCEHELDEGELERFYADAYKWQSFARR